MAREAIAPLLLQQMALRYSMYISTVNSCVLTSTTVKATTTAMSIRRVWKNIQEMLLIRFLDYMRLSSNRLILARDIVGSMALFGTQLTLTSFLLIEFLPIG